MGSMNSGHKLLKLLTQHSAPLNMHSTVTRQNHLDFSGSKMVLHYFIFSAEIVAIYNRKHYNPQKKEGKEISQ